MRSLFGFLFGTRRAWENRLDLARSILVILFIVATYYLLRSGQSSYAGMLFWIAFIGFWLSVLYQQIRRWRELRAQKKEPSEGT